MGVKYTVVFILTFFVGVESGGTCRSVEWQCHDGGCIPLDGRCDSIPDCTDESDEANCTESCSEDQISCGRSRVCVSSTLWCDGQIHCPGAEDETNCSPTTETSTVIEHTSPSADSGSLTEASIKMPIPLSSKPSTQSLIEASTEIPTKATTEGSSTPPIEYSPTDAIETSSIASIEASSIASTESPPLPSTQSSLLPSTESPLLPSTESSPLPSTESSLLASTESSLVPSTESSQVPSTESSSTDAPESSLIARTRSSLLSTREISPISSTEMFSTAASEILDIEQTTSSQTTNGPSSEIPMKTTILDINVKPTTEYHLSTVQLITERKNDFRTARTTLYASSDTTAATTIVTLTTKKTTTTRSYQGKRCYRDFDPIAGKRPCNEYHLKTGVCRGFCRQKYRGSYKHPHDCTRYYMCDWGFLHICVCPPKTRFDIRIHGCNWEYVVPCDI